MVHGDSALSQAASTAAAAEQKEEKREAEEASPDPHASEDKEKPKDSSDNIRVAVRIRPMIFREREARCRKCTRANSANPKQIRLGSESLFVSSSLLRHVVSCCVASRPFGGAGG